MTALEELKQDVERIAFLKSIPTRELERELYQRNTGGRATEILKICSDYSGFTVGELRSKNKTKPLSAFRQIAMYVMRESGLSYKDIRDALGRSDHHGIVFGCRRVKEDPDRLETAEKIMRLL